MPRLSIACCALALSLGCVQEVRELGPGEDPLREKEILEITRSVADWQRSHLDSDRRGWVNGVFYLGLSAAARATGEIEYRDYLVELGRGEEWQLGSRYRHADDHLIAQTYFELSEFSDGARTGSAFKDAIDRMMATPPDWVKDHQPIDYWWCDALFMSPPAIAQLAQQTGDSRYLRFLDRLWRQAAELLYDSEEGLFYRDTRFRDGAPGVYWSRGNGWVIAGLARLIDELPEDWESMGFYQELFRDLAGRALELQFEDGLWRSELLGIDLAAPGETSGSALFCYALAWGVNRGLLPRERFAPAAERAWSALYRRVNESGRLGWVQKPGATPRQISSRASFPYGSGAFLLAAEQMLVLQASSQ